MSEKKVIKASLGYTVGNYLLKGFSFLTVPLFARLLTTEDFGIYSAFIAYETILFVVLGAAIHTSYKNAKYRYDINGSAAEESGCSYSSYVSATVWLLTGNTVLFLVLGNVFSGLFSQWLGLNRLSINLLVLYSFSTAAINCFNADASLTYNYKSYLMIAGLNAIGNLLFSFVLILTVYSGQRYMGRTMGTVIPAFLIAVYIAVRKVKRDSPAHILSYLKWGLSFSTPIIFHGLSQVILSQFDRIMIRNIVSDTAAGLYSFGYTIFSIINVTFNSTDAVWSTWFFERLNKGETDKVRKYSTYYIFVIALICSLLMIVCPEVVTILGSAKYDESKFSAIPIIASGFFVFLYTLPAGVEYYYEKTKNIAYATVGAATINVILNVIFIRNYGYVAAAYTTLVTYILYFLFHHFQARKIAGYWLFSNLTCISTSVFVLLSMVLSLCLIDFVWIRWGIALILAAAAVLYEERKVKIARKIIKTLLERRR